MAEERILTIDDEPSIIRFCERALTRAGYTVRGASSGNEGLALLGEQPFDLVLLDVRLPDRDGIDVLSAIHDREVAIPVIMMTGHASMQTALDALKSGARELLLKPFGPDSLLSTVQRVLEREHQLREDQRLRGRLPILEISQALMSETSPARLTRLALGIIEQELGVRHVSLRLLDADQRWMEPVVHDTEGASRQETQAQVEEDVYRRVLETREPLLLVEGDESDPTVQEWLAQMHAGTAVCVPLVLRNRILGVVNAWRPLGAPPFHQDEVDLLSMLCGQVAVALENARLFVRAHREIAERVRAEEAETQRRREAEALRDIAAALNSSLELDQVLDLILDNVGRVVPHDLASVMFVQDGQARIVRYRGIQTDASEAVWTQRFLINEIPTLRQMTESLQPLAIPDTGQFDGWVTFPGMPHVSSYAGAPICWQDRVVGFLNLNSNQAGFFETAHAERLNVFAHQAAVAIENARLHEQVRSHVEQLEHRVDARTKELSALYEVTAVASESLELDVTLARSLNHALEAMGSSVGLVQLLDETTGELVVGGWQGRVLQDAPEMARSLQPVALARWIVDHNEPLVVPDVRLGARVPIAPGMVEAMEALDLCVFVGAPMRARGRILGVLSVLGPEDQGINVEDVALLASIADHVAVAVENDRLRQQAERAAVIEERERLARELHDSVTQSLYSLTLFAEAARELAVDGRFSEIEYYLDRVNQVSRSALKEMRLLVHELRPPVLEEEGLVGALRQRLEAVEGRVGVQARLIADELVQLPSDVEDALYRIAQEALNTALKHARAKTVLVHLGVGPAGEIELSVEDDGGGFDVEGARDGGGMGMTNMRERAEKLGGTLVVQSALGEGTCIRVQLTVNGARP